MNLKTIVQGFGAAILLMISHLAALASPYHAVLYHSTLPMRSVIWGTLIDLAALSLLAALLFGYLQKRQTSPPALLWVLIAAMLARTIIENIVAYLGWNIPGFTPTRVFVLTLVGALALWWLRPTAYRTTVHALRMLLFIAGCSAMWMIPELLYLGLRAERADAPMPVTNPALVSDPMNSTGRGGRIVWLLFDELSYDQTFDHRFNGLAMPSFDSFRSKSVVFSDLKPTGSSTELVIPSFFLGEPVSKMRSDLDGEPMLQLAGSKQWQAFDAHATLFSDADRLGWTTGVVGWFNPYCRMLAGTLDYCFWRMGDGEFDGQIATKSSLENAISPIQNIMWWLERKPNFLQQIHSADLAAIVPAATELIRDESISFVFIHLPVPHPPGIYDRRTGTLRASGTYIDNLALSDRVLRELIRSLNETALASKTTVIICSDHSWRLSVWRPRGLWSKEEETASHGHFDPRPVLMIHFPGQQAERDVTAPFEEIRIHELIEHMLRGEQPEFAQSLLAGGAKQPAATRP
jgi:hypothetical protein